jgi:nitrous oxidase accessory protein NosD
MRTAMACAFVTATVASISCTLAGEPTTPSRRGASMPNATSPSADMLPLQSLACGAHITADIRLDNDLTCTGIALVVSGDDIRIDLNGHTIEGNGATDGITVTASHAITIFGGTVKGFVSGIFVAGSADVVIRDNAFSMNRQAVLLQATTGSVVKHNVVANQVMRGFMIRPNTAGVLSTDNTIIDNVVTGTPTGVFLIRQPGNIVQTNSIIGSTVAGIDLAEGAGSVSDNIVRANLLSGGAAGIRFSAGWAGNTFAGNRIESNVCGTKGSTAGNVLNGNVFFDNSTDACP